MASIKKWINTTHTLTTGTQISGSINGVGASDAVGHTFTSDYTLPVGAYSEFSASSW